LIKLIDVGRKTICKGIESNLAYKTYTPLWLIIPLLYIAML
jgi:hypothetical protein